jgi:4-carboxymuconolactone decarboxylase
MGAQRRGGFLGDVGAAEQVTAEIIRSASRTASLRALAGAHAGGFCFGEHGCAAGSARSRMSNMVTSAPALARSVPRMPPASPKPMRAMRWMGAAGICGCDAAWKPAAMPILHEQFLCYKAAYSTRARAIPGSSFWYYAGPTRQVPECLPKGKIREAQQRYEKGLAVRRAVLGDEYVDRAIASADSFTGELQEFVTEWVWGGVWTRPGLPRKTRSLLNLAMLAALNRPHEVKMHVKGALQNGVTRKEMARKYFCRWARMPGCRRRSTRFGLPRKSSTR